MHGEYKTPGGKLVVADVDVAGDRLARVQISGDFFLEPDDAVERIDAAVTGLPATADTPKITASIEAAERSRHRPGPPARDQCSAADQRWRRDVRRAR